MMKEYQTLDWDSSFFGFQVVKLTQEVLGIETLVAVIQKLKREKVRLAYWASEKLPYGYENILLELGGYLVDRKVTYVKKLVDINDDCVEASSIFVGPYTRMVSEEQLIALAIQSGAYSRFALDKNIPRKKFEDLYSLWIKRSITKEIAKEVLIASEHNRAIGLITVGCSEEKGEIGLLAVDENNRGRKIGETLVRAAQRWFCRYGYRHSQVVTQGVNLAACRLYEKCGYTVEKEKHYYHFWL